MTQETWFALQTALSVSTQEGCFALKTAVRQWKCKCGHIVELLEVN
jgi:hypothetical protein